MLQFEFWAILIVIARYCPSGEGDTGDGHAGGCPRTQVRPLSAAYAASLRVPKVVALKVSDIDSERLLLRIEHEQGKGRKDRFAMLSPGCWTCCATGIGERMCPISPAAEFFLDAGATNSD